MCRQSALVLVSILALLALPALADSDERVLLLASSPSAGAPSAVWELGTEGPVRRVDLPPKAWASLLFWDAPDLASEFLRIQADAPVGYLVHIVHVDLVTWQVRTILVSDQAHELAATAKHVLIATDAGVRRIDRQTLAVHELDSRFDVVERFGPVWLVRLGDGKGAFFDVETASLLDARFDLPKAWSDGLHSFVLRADREYVAAVDTWFQNDAEHVKLVEAPRVLTAVVRVLALGSGEVVNVPVRVWCTAGSGIPVLPDGLGFDFDRRTGDLEVLSRRSDGVIEIRAIAPATGEEVSRREATREERDRLVRASWRREDGARPAPEVPRWLESGYRALDGVSDEGGRRIVHAFLAAKGVEYRIPGAVGETEVAFSPDGKRFVAILSSVRGEIFRGDLATKDMRRFPLPDALSWERVELFWVNVR